MDEEKLVQTLKNDIAEIFNDIIIILDNRLNHMEGNIEQKFINFADIIDEKMDKCFANFEIKVHQKFDIFLNSTKDNLKQHHQYEQDFAKVKEYISNCEVKK